MQNPLRIDIPKRLWGNAGSDMLTRLTSWEWRQPYPEQDGLVLDFSNNQFIEPWALAMLAAYALHVRFEHHLPVVTRVDMQNPANQWLVQMGIEDVINDGISTESWDESYQNTGLHVIASHSDVTRFAKSVSALDLSRNREVADALTYCVAEMGRNIVQHAASPSGGIAMAQVFPDREAVQISVCDSGQGILSALKATHPELKTHREALKASVLPHVSGAFSTGSYSASDNAGLGLFFTKEIAWRAGGSFFLVSGGEVLSERTRRGLTGNRSYAKIISRIGTSVTVDIPTSKLIDFASLLELCRELARKARNSPGEAGLDFLSEFPNLDGVNVIHVGEFNEDVNKAAQVRESLLVPMINHGEMVILDFEGSRFATQSFVHALLNDVFRLEGSLNRLSFVNCTRSTEEAIRVVAAYAATYKMCV